jgi:hypothetical protein
MKHNKNETKVKINFNKTKYFYYFFISFYFFSPKRGKDLQIYGFTIYRLAYGEKKPPNPRRGEQGSAMNNE